MNSWWRGTKEDYLGDLRHRDHKKVFRPNINYVHVWKCHGKGTMDVEFRRRRSEDASMMDHDSEDDPSGVGKEEECTGPKWDIVIPGDGLLQIPTPQQLTLRNRRSQLGNCRKITWKSSQFIIIVMTKQEIKRKG